MALAEGEGEMGVRGRKGCKTRTKCLMLRPLGDLENGLSAGWVWREGGR